MSLNIAVAPNSKSRSMRKAVAFLLSTVFLFGVWGSSVAAIAAPVYQEMTGGLNVYSGTNSSGSTERTTTIAGHDFIEAVFGTAGWASSNAYNFSNGSVYDYRATFDSARGDSAAVANYFDGATLGFCGVVFKEPQVVARIGYRARQAADRLNGAILEGSNDNINFDLLYTLDGASTSANTYRTGANGLICSKAYKYIRLSGTSALNGALNPYELKLYTFGNGEAILETLALPDSVYSEVTLPNSVGGYPISWISNTPEIITNDGIVVAPEQPRPVSASLTASVEFDGVTSTRTFSLSVINYEESFDSDAVKGMELIANFDFNDPATGLVGAGAKANVHGTPRYIAGKNGTMAASLGSNFWLDVTKEDGSSLLKGLSEFAVSYDSSPASSGNNGWTFFATRTYRAPKSNYESYLGIIDVSNNITVERFHNFGARPDFGLYASATAGWRHVDVVFSKGVTKIYINGALKNIQTSDYTLEQVLSAAGGILYVGRSTWGSENFTGLVDNFKIWKPFDPDDAGKVAAAKADLNLPYDLAQNPVYGNITLPKAGLYGTTITWATDSPAIVDVNEYANPGGDPKLAGTVTRPAADTTVTMTATISFGNVSDTKTFRFLVKKAPVATPDKEAYLFAHFTGTEGSATDEQIYFAVSDDAKTWKDMTASGKPILTSKIGDKGVRDPYLIRSPEGDKFYLIATDLSIYSRGGWGNASWQNSSTKLAIWESNDLVHWSDMRLVEVAGPIRDAGMAWAPEAVYDDTTGDYLVFWATLTTIENSVGSAPTIFYARTRDFRTFSKPKQWILRNDIIDTTVLKANDGYWYRATQTGNILLEKSTSLTGTWQTIGNLQTIFSGAWSYGAVEGPELFVYNQKDWQGGVPTYGLYVDRYGTGAGYMPFYTSDLSATTRPPWYAGTDINMGSLKKRHGGILSITKAEYDAVVKAYSTSTSTSALDTSKMNLICDFNFNSLASSGNTTVTGGGARGTISGTISRSTDRPDSSGYSANFGSSGSNFITVTNESGAPLLTGLDEVVISYDSKPSTMSGNGGWSFYAATNTTAQVNSQERYLGIMDKRTGSTAESLLVERYRNAGGRPGNNLTWSSTAATAWKHVDLWVRKDSTILYVNGVQVSSSASNYLLSEIMSSTGGIIQIGKANWGSGEYYRGLIDNFKIYDATGAAPPSGLLTAITAPTPTYTTIRTAIDSKAFTAKMFISYNNSQVKDLSAVPLNFTLLAGAQIVDRKTTYDLTSPVSITITSGEGDDLTTEQWTISAELDHNPVLPGRYADPDVIIANGKYYIYPTTDGYASWAGYQFKVFSSDDMINWEDEGIIVDLQASAPYQNTKGVTVATVPWSNGNAWAPAIEQKDGKFYFYFCGNDTSVSGNLKAIGVAVSDSPTGPFTVKSTPIMTMAMCSGAGVSMGQTIDPQIYTENGTSYMLFGNGNAAICQLGEDMISWVPGTLKNISGATDLREAIDVIKIDGMYHFTWSCDDTGSENYRVRYGISDKLYGPILDKGIILQKDNANDIKGTGHHAILYHPDRNEYYIVYHRFWTPLGQSMPGGLGNNRETCIDKLGYKNGLFTVTTPTNLGVYEPVYAMGDGKTVLSHQKLKPNDKLTATTALIGASQAIENAVVILALYDANNKLLAIDSTAPFNVNAGEYKVLQTSIQLPANVTGLQVKTFILDANYTPLRADSHFKF